MSDNVTLPATGTGTASVVQATDDVSGAHYPKVKLADGTADSSTMVAAGNGTAANALRVTLASDSPGVQSEDDAHVSTDTGIMMLGVANEAAGTFGADNDYTPIATDTKGHVYVRTSDESEMSIIGNKAHDTADAGAPVKVGAAAISDIAGATMVAAADRTDLYAGLDGVLLTRPYTTLANCLSERITATATAEVASTAFTGAAGVRQCLTSIMAFNTSTTVSTFIDITNGTGGTVLASMPVPAGGGSTMNFPVPLVTTIATGIYVKPAAAATTLYVTMVGFKSKA